MGETRAGFKRVTSVNILGTGSEAKFEVTPGYRSLFLECYSSGVLSELEGQAESPLGLEHYIRREFDVLDGLGRAAHFELADDHGHENFHYHHPELDPCKNP
jgi:hypothetical protein